MGCCQGKGGVDTATDASHSSSADGSSRKRKLDDRDTSASSKRQKTQESSLLSWLLCPLRLLAGPPRLQDLAGDHCAGHLSRLVLHKKPPFGFIRPQDGSADLFFNESLLAAGVKWEDVVKTANQHEPGTSPVIFRKGENSTGRPQAVGVVVLDSKRGQELDDNQDGHISQQELAVFLASHGLDLKTQFEHSRECYEQQQRESELESKRRGDLYDRQTAEENKLWEKRNAERDEVQRLYEDAEKLWSESRQDWASGHHQASKEKQAKAKELQALAKKHQMQAQAYKQEVLDLDWKNNEEMFEYVQSHEHTNRERDGTWLDLHGLSAEFAEHKTLEVLLAAKAKGIRMVEVITGAGHHSGKSGPKVKVRILSFLRKPPRSLMGIRFEEVNDGCLNVILY